MEPEDRARLRRHLALIEDGVAPVVARYRDHIQCRPGCSDCCHQTFRISALEGELLREGLREAPPAMAEAIRDRARGYLPDQRMPCPVLSPDGRCRLYAHRPRICRKYGIPLWHPERPHEVRTCPLNFQNVPDIDAALILDPQAGWAEDWLVLGQELGRPSTERRTIAEHILLDDPAR